MDAGERIERTLSQALARSTGPGCPAKLASAMHHAIFPGGARVRPLITLAVAEACGGANSTLADAAAAAIEMLHCASLAHDDLPCFDNADTRRGRPSVHAANGITAALLAGDSLIVLAFETLARAGASRPELVAPLIGIVARGVGAPNGIAAGQAWEDEAEPPPELYRCAKTGALFVAATMSGALAGGGDPSLWRGLGERLGEAYQVADDLLDAVSSAEDCDKPVGRDAALGRPSAVTELGIDGATQRLQSLVRAAVTAIPRCRGETALRELVKAQALRLAPKRLTRSAA